MAALKPSEIENRGLRMPRCRAMRRAGVRLSLVLDRRKAGPKHVECDLDCSYSEYRGRGVRGWQAGEPGRSVRVGV